mmetsp:Transcript_73003/g.205048  ORF Transcript_73003/g.205048 Transcript_73003/m.205048 type:complete len:84 (+) Transcript_73003:199-450(+)
MAQCITSLVARVVAIRGDKYKDALRELDAVTDEFEAAGADARAGTRADPDAGVDRRGENVPVAVFAAVAAAASDELLVDPAAA